MIDPTLVHTILNGYTLPPLGYHGLSHWARVLENGLRLAETTGADRRVVEMFAVFHDARRVNEARDPGHGARGADLARDMRADWLDLTDEQFALLEYACIHHTDGLTAADVTAQTCWDADRLDLWRVYITPRDEYLCTAAAKDPQMQAWAKERSETYYTPAYVTDEWLAGRSS